MTTPSDAYNLDVVIKDQKIEMEKRVYAGPTNFIVRNEAQQARNLVVMGEDTDRKFEKKVQPGEEKVMMVQLEPGEYQIFCPADDLIEEGLQVNLEVTGAEQAAPPAR